jgi:uncharacterized protein with FMN-binding domain
MTEQQGSPIGDPLLERLERLAARQGRTSGPRPLPPPEPGVSAALAPPPRSTGRSSPRAPRRRHPARSARIGALVASCATTGGLAYLFAGTGTSQASPIPDLVAPIATSAPAPTVSAPAETTTTTTSSTGTSATASSTTAPGTTAAPTPTTASTTVTTGGALVGFDGDTISTRFGPVQVQAQIQNGTLVAVAVVQYPDDDGKSIRINERALPELQSEALTAQSARVDTISGATYTSNAYVQSLQSALDEAIAAGVFTA